MKTHLVALFCLSQVVFTPVAMSASLWDKCISWVHSLGETSEPSKPNERLEPRDSQSPNKIVDPLPELERVEFSVPRPGEDPMENEVSLLFFTGTKPELDNLTSGANSFVRDEIAKGTIKIINNGPIVAIMSETGVGHPDLRTLLPSGARILGGTRFKRTGEGLSKTINSTTFSQLDGIDIQNRYFIFKMEN